MILQYKLKCQEIDITKRLISLTLHKNLTPKDLIEGKFGKKICIQVSIRILMKIFKGKYSKNQIHRILKRLEKSGTIKKIDKSSAKNKGCWIALNDNWHEWSLNEAKKNPNYIIPEILKNAGQQKNNAGQQKNDDNQQVKNISSIEVNAGQQNMKKVSKSQEVREDSTVYNVISKDITKNNVNETLSSFSSNYYRLSRVPKSEEHLRKRLEKSLTSEQMEIAVKHWKINPGKDFGWYYNAGKYDWDLPITKETIAQENKQIGLLTAKKLILQEGERLEICNTYLEFVIGIHSIPISYGDRNFLEKLENHLKKRGYPSLEKLGIIIVAA